MFGASELGIVCEAPRGCGADGGGEALVLSVWQVWLDERQGGSGKGGFGGKVGVAFFFFCETFAIFNSKSQGMMDKLRHPRVELIHHGRRKGARQREGRWTNFTFSGIYFSNVGRPLMWLEGGEGEDKKKKKSRKDVGVKGQQVLWEGITGLRLLHVSLLGRRGRLAWK